MKFCHCISASAEVIALTKNKNTIEKNLLNTKKVERKNTDVNINTLISPVSENLLAHQVQVHVQVHLCHQNIEA